MSGGAGEDGSRGLRKDDGELRRNTGRVDSFGHSIARISVSQLCECAGFQGVQQSAIDALADIGMRYLSELGKTAHLYANSAGRTDCNVFDIVQGLEDLGSYWGFAGASDVNRCLSGSGVIRDIVKYVSISEEIPFVRHVPRFPVPRSRKLTPSFAQMGETPPDKHIPDWLPAFPDPQTFIHTPLRNDQTTVLQMDKFDQERHRKKAERPLFNLQQRYVRSVAEGSCSIDANLNGGKAKVVPESNPFLAAPLQFEEKDDALRVPTKLSSKAAVVEKPVSILETFAPAIEALKNGVCNLEEEKLRENERKILPYKRPTVHFTFGVNKKSIAVPLRLNSRNTSAGEMGSWFSCDEKNEEKKRRPEQILEDSIENQQDLPQL